MFYQGRLTSLQISVTWEIISVVSSLFSCPQLTSLCSCVTVCVCACKMNFQTLFYCCIYSDFAVESVDSGEQLEISAVILILNSEQRMTQSNIWKRLCLIKKRKQYFGSGLFGLFEQAIICLFHEVYFITFSPESHGSLIGHCLFTHRDVVTWRLFA